MIQVSRPHTVFMVGVRGVSAPPLLLTYRYLCVLQHMYTCVQRAEGSLQESVFFLHLVGPGGQTQVVRLGSCHPCLMSHVTVEIILCY